MCRFWPISYRLKPFHQHCPAWRSTSALAASEVPQPSFEQLSRLELSWLAIKVSLFVSIHDARCSFITWAANSFSTEGSATLTGIGSFNLWSLSLITSLYLAAKTNIKLGPIAVFVGHRIFLNHGSHYKTTLMQTYSKAKRFVTYQEPSWLVAIVLQLHFSFLSADFQLAGAKFVLPRLSRQT